MTTRSFTPAASTPGTPRAATIADLEPDFALMVEKAMAAIGAGEAKPDLVFGAFAGFISMARSVSYHEGKLLEAGIIRIAACNPDLAVMPQERPMPIVPAALEFLARNEWNSLEGIRLRSEVHYRKTYTPDLVIVNRKERSALIVDVKRSLASYQERRLNALRQRMMAAALIGADWLYVECQAPLVSEVGIAIVDGAGEASDHAKGIFGLFEVGGLLGVEGAGEALAHLRAMFAARVRQELERQCRKVLISIGPPRPPHLMQIADESCSSDEAEAEDDGAPAVIGLAPARRGGSPRPEARVRVGFARSRASP